jgi:hypothetical protein
MEGGGATRTSTPRAAGRRLAAGVIVALMFVGAFSLWTLIPFGWVWVGSQLSDTQQPQMSVYALVLVGIIGSIVIVARLLSMLNRRLGELMGFEEGSRVPMPWMRSMRDEERHSRASALDIVLVASACAAGLAMFVWFVLFAGSPLPSQ